MVRIVPNQNVATIPQDELQAHLAMDEHCVVVPGSMQAFDDRMDEMDIEVYRGSGLGFGKRGAYRGTFHVKEYSAGHITFLRFGAGDSFKFKRQVDEATLKQLVLDEFAK